MIEIEGLKKRFGQSIALDEVSMHVRDGAMYGFVGRMVQERLQRSAA